jgi:CRISPR-associated protein Cas2
MQILLIYDIVHNGQRSKVATACLDYGLDRVQYSAFSGTLSGTHQEELMLRIKSIIGDGAARVHLYPIDEKAWQRRLVFETVSAEVMEDLLDMEDFDVPRSADE